MIDHLLLLQVEDIAQFLMTSEAPISNKILLQPYSRNKTYKPVSFKPFSDKIAQVTS